MSSDLPINKPEWDEQNSQEFIDLADCIVPERKLQTEIICSLVSARQHPFIILDICCGEGLLAEALLNRFKKAIVIGLDGSETMLKYAQERLSGYGDRFRVKKFDLRADDWRDPSTPMDAVVSSLALHHLTGYQKQKFYQDMFRLLSNGGEILIADLIAPPGAEAVQLAARLWDDIVRQRAKETGKQSVWEVFKNDHWNTYTFPDEMDKPSGLFEQLKWLDDSGFSEIDVYWMKAGHVVFGGRKRR